LESSWWVIRVHWLGLRLFGAMVWKLSMIIEPFSQWKLNKIKREDCIGIWEHSWCYWKAFGKSDLIKFVSQLSELLRCARYRIFEWILLLEIQKNYKNWVWKEKSVKPSMCSHLGHRYKLH
jgi:hypothetical protein